MVLNAAFKQKEKGQPKDGHEVEVKDSRKELSRLSDVESKFANAFRKVKKKRELKVYLLNLFQIKLCYV